MSRFERPSPADFQQAIERWPKAALAAFGGGIAMGLIVMAVWPGGAPVTVPIAGVLVAMIAGAVVPWLLDRRPRNQRDAYFRTREDVERVLGLQVLAAHPNGALAQGSARSRSD